MTPALADIPSPVIVADPWTIRECDFPAHDCRWQQLRFILNYALLAPSSHNTQPWRFRILPGGAGVELWADRTRALPVADPDSRELFISCGAALLNLRLALDNFALPCHTALFPDSDEPDLIARLTLAGASTQHDGDRLLFQNIVWRHTSRAAFQDWTIPLHVLDHCQAQAELERASLHFIPAGAPRDELASLVSEASLIQAADPLFRRELAAWVRPNWGASEDGIPAWALGVRGRISSSITPWFLREFNWGAHAAKADARKAREAPVLAVLATETDSPEAWVSAGQALERVLLRASAEGIRASYLNQPLQVASLRPRVAPLIGGGAPQMIFRLGYAFHAKPTPRRPLDCVLG
jgi:nitroreductase